MTKTDKESSRVIRGGSWYYPAASLRVASRDWSGPSYRYGHLGFRLIEEIENE